MHCTNCGKEVLAQAEFCAGCGSRVHSAAQAPPAKKKRSAWKWVLGIFGVLFLIGLFTPRSPQGAVINGVRIDELRVASRRDSQRRASLSIQITNTTDKDISGMRIEFLGGDDSGDIGPFYLPQRGTESEWSLKAGESRTISTFIVGFGVRDVSNVKPVGVEILGADFRGVADRPEPERRMIFALLVSCERDADRQAQKKYPDSLGVFEKQVEYAHSLRDKCVEEVSAGNNLSEADRMLISSEGVQIGWPPLGSN